MRGQVQDLVVIVIILFATAITVFFGYIILDAFYSDPVFSANAAASGALEQGMTGMQIIGNSFIFLFMGFGIVSVISAFYTDTHPVFFVFSILVFAICVMLVGLFSDVFVEMASNGVLLPVVAEFTLMVDTMVNLQTLAIGLGVAIIIALYAKRSDLRLGGGQA